ncbi:MAG: rRNA pseudouridine synthase [Chlamydiales bacterium]|nr:rRNA pseudouridine synthase [Chlamydiales bacterium]
METKKRLSKALAAAGVASRRACEELIFAGKVKVNGKVVFVPQTLVSWEHDTIQVHGRLISNEEKKVYYILNKPTGYICSNARVGTKKIVTDLFEPLTHRLFTIGRLDRDTTGLILVTNDGHFSQKVIHPSSNVQKEYLVKVQEEIKHEHLETIGRGAEIEGTWVKPQRVTKVRRGTLKVVVLEGKKREVRYLVEKAGLQILSLERIRIGGLTLGRLALGAWRSLTEKEKEAIFQ